MSSIDVLFSKVKPPTPVEGEDTTQFELMVAGKPYLAMDKYLCRIRDEQAEKLCQINQTRSMEERMKLYADLVNLRGGEEGNVIINIPFTCEYGSTITFGRDIYVGHNCQFFDVCPITIGDRTMIGPNCQLYTPAHPLSPEERNGLTGPEWAKPITIGKDCWLGGGVIIVPGVTIGDGVTVGAGSVVTKDVPNRCVVAGNPARIVKRIKEDGTVVAP
ncbi:maltose O-acetyltransferase [Cryptococcus neoformans var. grubii H99]|uniref:Maltose O-acetyltransferase n=2 Tax=Cryptococcus neoformans TaxID=5207 RepID=J9W0V7_CRYN9|nr:maltose O-acetyltransferase [Cryptococcus neoformans var. grubii H99]ABE73177.1 putative O-acetyl transferase [Cryptococcus neoformans var. grubii]AFR97695.1 maltose O-acetyltransferase [Cryptococcus neoformans var. grubii H99]AUB27746.1 maltose O-acetyltransferase [Cryptococcus neoformans var. grubii]|eukprot:XP_012052555.1 maltose O-acetyltransferase [Cryptococcus neoformans var. grubii H99]